MSTPEQERVTTTTIGRVRWRPLPRALHGRAGQAAGGWLWARRARHGRKEARRRRRRQRAWPFVAAIVAISDDLLDDGDHDIWADAPSVIA